MTSSERLEAWGKARPGRVVGKPERVNVKAKAFACECAEGGKRVCTGKGRPPTPRIVPPPPRRG